MSEPLFSNIHDLNHVFLLILVYSKSFPCTEIRRPYLIYEHMHFLYQKTQQADNQTNCHFSIQTIHFQQYKKATENENCLRPKYQNLRRGLKPIAKSKNQ